MANPQFELTARLASEFGLKVIRLRYADGLVFEDGEVVKIFMPSSKRILGCGPQDRRVIGELLCLFREDLKAPTARSKKLDFDQCIFGAPDANFSGLTLHSLLSDGPMDKLFQIGLEKLFAALPSTRAGWEKEFGADFLTADPLDRFSFVVRYLRDRLESLGEPFIKRPPPAHISIKIEGL